MLFLRHSSSFAPVCSTIARPSPPPRALLSSAAAFGRLAHWRGGGAHAVVVAASAEAASVGRGRRGGGGGGGRGGGRGGRARGGRGGGKKAASPPLDLTTADIAAVALSVDPALITAPSRRLKGEGQEEGEEEGDGGERGADGDADDDDALSSSSSPTSSSSSPRLPDALHAALPDRFPTLSAARRAIRRGAVLVAAAGADDGAFASVAPPEALALKARAACSSSSEAAAAASISSPPSSSEGAAAAFVVGNCGTLVLGAGVWIVALEPGAEAAGRAGERREAALRVVYEDDCSAVVVKPWGVLMSGGDPSRTVSGALARMAAAAASGVGGDKNDDEARAPLVGLRPSPRPDALARPQAAHRLDAAVGGLVAVGKTASALADMARAFRERRVRKRYRALLRGRLEPAEAVARGLAEALVEGEAGGDGRVAVADEAAALDEAFFSPAVGAGSSSSSSSPPTNPPPLVLSVRLPLDGKPCETRLAVAGYSRCPRYGGWLTTVDLEPVTGRQHQLRRHCAALGHAVVGDGRYRGGEQQQQQQPQPRTGKEEEEVEEEEGQQQREDGRHIGGQGLFLESAALAFERRPGQGGAGEGGGEEDEGGAAAAATTAGGLLVEQAEPRRFVTLRAQQRSAWAKAQRVRSRAEEAEAEAEAAGVGA